MQTNGYEGRDRESDTDGPWNFLLLWMHCIKQFPPKEIQKWHECLLCIWRMRKYPHQDRWESLRTTPSIPALDNQEGTTKSQPLPGEGRVWATYITLQSLSHVLLVVVPWTAAHQASLSFVISWSWLCIRWPKYWSFSISISPSSEYSGLISFRMDWLDLLAVQGTLKSSLAPQFKSINSLVLSFLYSPTLTSKHDYQMNSFEKTLMLWG